MLYHKGNWQREPTSALPPLIGLKLVSANLYPEQCAGFAEALGGHSRGTASSAASTSRIKIELQPIAWIFEARGMLRGTLRTDAVIHH